MLRRIGVSDRWAKAFDVAIVLFATLGIVQIVLWFDRARPVTVHLRVVQAEHVRVPPGGKFRYENYFTRQRYCETLVNRWFVGSDGVRREIDPLPASMPTDGLNRRQMSVAIIKVPPAMPPGPSKSCFQSTWQCGGNPVQKIWPLSGDETCLPFIVEQPRASVGGGMLSTAPGSLASVGEF